MTEGRREKKGEKGRTRTTGTTRTKERLGEETHGGDILVEYDNIAEPSVVAFLKWLIGRTGRKIKHFKRSIRKLKIEIPKFCN